MSGRAGPAIRPVEWLGDRVRILDQTALPVEERYVEAREPGAVAAANRGMAVRGAPLLGIAAAYGMALGAATSGAPGPRGVLRDLRRAGAVLVRSRPTAANIEWAVRRVLAAAEAADGNAEAVRGAAALEARRIAEEDEASCLAIGRLGAELVPHGANVLTHCNTGSLATGGVGTAQGVIVAAHEDGKNIHVWVDETRPVLQGARLTAWELRRLRIPMTLVADVAAGALMAEGAVDLVVVGADRVAANGDVANKVGTYPLAVLARHHGLPFYVAAPVSTIDPTARTGADIVVERRGPDEITSALGVRIAPEGTRAVNPAFDLTPSDLITAIVTDRGVVRRPLEAGLRRLLSGRGPGAGVRPRGGRRGP